MSEFIEEPGVFPEGPYTAWSETEGLRAVVRKSGKTVKVFNSETAWSDAVRYAGDMNSEELRNRR